MARLRRSPRTGWHSGRPEARSRRSGVAVPTSEPGRGEEGEVGSGPSAERASPRRSRLGRPRSSRRADPGLELDLGGLLAGSAQRRDLDATASGAGCSISARRCSRRSSRSPALSRSGSRGAALSSSSRSCGSAICRPGGSRSRSILSARAERGPGLLRPAAAADRAGRSATVVVRANTGDLGSGGRRDGGARTRGLGIPGVRSRGRSRCRERMSICSPA